MGSRQTLRSVGVVPMASLVAACLVAASDAAPVPSTGPTDGGADGAWGEMTSRVSLAPDGSEADALSLRAPALSASGRYVAFTSAAANLVAGDANGATDVFLRDRLTDRTALVSVRDDGSPVGEGGASTPSLSGDGMVVAFESDDDAIGAADASGTDVFVRDLAAGRTLWVSADADGGDADGDSYDPVLSVDGGLVVFASDATDLVPGDDNGVGDVFLHDVAAGTTRGLSVDLPGVPATGSASAPTLSADGFVAAFVTESPVGPGDTNEAADVVVLDLRTGEVLVASLAGGAAGPEAATGAGASQGPSLSADGRWVAFTSSAPDLVPGDTNAEPDVFVRDLATGTTERVSVGPQGAELTGGSAAPSVSASGARVAFATAAIELAGPGAPGTVAVHDRDTGTTRVAAVGSAGAPADGASAEPALSADGRHLAFLSQAAGLVAGDANGSADVFVRDLPGDDPVVLGGPVPAGGEPPVPAGAEPPAVP